MLNVALTGLRAFQSALNTTSHNITNANTPGYSRQRVDLTTQTPAGYGGLTTGSGVMITGISRSADDLLAAQMRRASSAYSRLDAYADKAGSMNTLFADSQTGLSATLQKFTNALQGVANTPASVSSRQVLLSEAGGLVTRLKTYESRLDDIEAGVNDQLRAETASINSIAQNIAQLNEQIAQASGNGLSPPNDLLDARDQQLADLAGRVDTSVVRQDDGSVNVFIGKGQPLVLGKLVSNLVAQQDNFQPDRVTLAISSPSGSIDVTGSLSGGTIGGLMDFRREMLDPARNELGRMAVALTDVTNAQHRAGQDLNGNLGGDFFAVGPAQALSSRNNDGTAALTVTRTSTGQLGTDDYVVSFESGSWRVQRSNGGQPVPYTLGGGGELQFEGLSVSVSGTAQQGDRFLVKPTGTAIDGLQVLVRDPAQIAAAAPIRTSAASTNSGGATISAGDVLDPTNAALRDTVRIEFTGPGNWRALNSSNAVIATGAYSAGGNIDVNGWRVQVGGTPATGDTFTVASNTGGTGDNRNALKLAAVLTRNVLGNGTESLDAASTRLVSSVGVATNGANASLDAQKIVYDNSKSAIDELSGVNLDEEAANLMRFQQAYQAAAQMIRVAQTIFDSIIASVGR
jgi:flagellar hook-associated protein 1 FlgK